jgi:hypothetical protein
MVNNASKVYQCTREDHDMELKDTIARLLAIVGFDSFAFQPDGKSVQTRSRLLDAANNMGAIRSASQKARPDRNWCNYV